MESTHTHLYYDFAIEMITLRIRTQIGLWRLKDVDTGQTLSEVKARLERERACDLEGRPFTMDEIGEIALQEDVPISLLNFANGQILYMKVDEEKTNVSSMRAASGSRITKEGNIVAQEYENVVARDGFRPGMMPLRSMKNQWTLNDLVELDEQFTFNFTKMKKKREAFCKKATMNTEAIADLIRYMYNFDYQKIRVGYLYGKVNTDDNTVVAEAIYEPPQESTDVYFELLEDSKEDKVNAIASLLGLQKVGWVYVHPPRADFDMSNLEAITAAELQLEAANGIEDTTFVTIRVTLKKEYVEKDGKKGSEYEWQPAVDAFQTHKLCMEMVAEGALHIDDNPGFVRVDDSFTALVEMKEKKQLETQLLTALVPIEQKSSTDFPDFVHSLFPKCNRDGEAQTRDDLKKQLEKEGKEGWNMKDLLKDFHLLVFLSEFLDIKHDIPALISAINNPEARLEDGTRLLIRSIAGFEL
jgi:nuclear protein localization protein 4 homolog